jgi:hypothetical protein
VKFLVPTQEIEPEVKISIVLSRVLTSTLHIEQEFDAPAQSILQRLNLGSLHALDHLFLHSSDFRYLLEQILVHSFYFVNGGEVRPTGGALTA